MAAPCQGPRENVAVGCVIGAVVPDDIAAQVRRHIGIDRLRTRYEGDEVMEQYRVGRVGARGVVREGGELNAFRKCAGRETDLGAG